MVSYLNFVKYKATSKQTLFRQRDINPVGPVNIDFVSSMA